MSGAARPLRLAASPELAEVTLREGDVVLAQWWGNGPLPATAWYVPADASQVPYARCRPGGVLLVRTGVRDPMTEACRCSAPHAAQELHDRPAEHTHPEGVPSCG